MAAWGGGDLSPPISDATGQCGAGVTPQMAHSLLSAASSGFEILERGKVSACRGGCWRRADALHLPLQHRGMLSPRLRREAPRCFRLSLPLKGIALPAPRWVFLIYFLLSLPTSPMSDYLFQQHNAAFRGNRLCAQQIRAVDKLTALRRVYDFIDLRQRLASMETALLAPEPRRGTSGFVLLDLGKAHLYRCVLLIP